ncbi:YdeI/OmpD-associated family protein [Mucilaginibacter sp.]|uniref:YdeI/OmpD-associated family protein n=1 Tax=Mucilaginibacter sp. TaxID=1882438 RepID=UPI0025EDEE17|nr:YdeI/OmpD-associated family protein [Mucilaginibacter sp.]
MHTISAVAKKLLIKPGKNWLFYDAPEDYLAVLEPLPEGVVANFNTVGEFDGVQLFVKNSGELIDSLKTIMPILKSDTVFWVTYPKKSSGIPSDLEMMSSWDELDRYGYNGVAAAAINNIWTALRFRPRGQSKVSDSCNEEIKKNDYANYIDVDNKQIKLPDEMQQVLANEPAAMEFYQKLSYSNKKEYVVWILSAKQEKTKNERLVKLVEKLSEGKKNPSEK